MDLDDNYKQFISEMIRVISHLNQSKSDVIIAGDFNIDLLKINENPVFNDIILT